MLLLKIDRTAFVPEGVSQEGLFIDSHFEIMPNRFLMQPMILARMISCIDVDTKYNILEIGGATGYSSHILSYLCNRVLNFETEPLLYKHADQLVTKRNMKNIDVINNLNHYLIDNRAFDIIFVHGYYSTIPDFLFDLLRDEGIMIAGIQSDNSVNMLDNNFVLSDVCTFYKTYYSVEKKVHFSSHLFPAIKLEK